MAKIPSSAIGIDIGRYTMKAVALTRRGNGRLVLTHFATRELGAEPRTVDAVAANLKALLGQLGGKGKVCAIAVSPGDSFLRIIEQPDMPAQSLRDSLRYTSQTLLNQDCRDFVLDCDRIGSVVQPEGGENGSAVVAPAQPLARYLVGGVPRLYVRMLFEACKRAKIPPTSLQLAPVATLNAFEHAHEATFSRQAFVLANMGHGSSTVIVGVKGELVVFRVLEYGGRQFVEEMAGQATPGPGLEAIVQKLQEDDPALWEAARLSLTELIRSISSSIGFVEARHEELIPRIYLEGGLARIPQVPSLLTEELQLPCETWSPFAKCDIEVPKDRLALLTAEMPMLAAAFGAAAALLQPPKKR